MDTSRQTIPQFRARRSAASRRQPEPPVNVGTCERWLSLLGGGLLALVMVRRALGPAMLIGAAGSLLYRGWTGHCGLYQTMGMCTATHAGPPDDTRPGAGPDDAPLIVVAGS